jgi:hypothetical protein
MRITLFWLSLFFRRVKISKVEEKAAIIVCVKLKISAIEMFEVLKSAYGERCLSRTTVSEWHERFNEGRETVTRR